MNRKVICIEGPDRCGKSSQVKLLWKWLSKNSDSSIMNMHFSGLPSKDASYRNFHTMFDIVEENEYVNFILDRSHIGEVVYAPIYRNYDGNYVFGLEEEFDLSDYYLITFVDDPMKIAIREDSASLSNGELEIIKQEIEAFKDATLRSFIPNKILIDIFDLSIEQVHAEVVSFLTN